MSIKRIIILFLLSLLITSLSPFMFSAYFEIKPESLTQASKFGGPFPFAQQSITLPTDHSKYPLEVRFASPFERETKFHTFPFMLSFSFFFLLILSLISILFRFFKGSHKQKSE